MPLNKKQILRYSIVYRVIMVIILLLIFHFIADTIINLLGDKTLEASEWLVSILKILTGCISVYFVLNYILYVFSWKATVTREGCVVSGLKQTDRIFTWQNGDLLALETYNLILINNPIESSSGSYRLSAWVNNKKALVESQLEHFKQEDFSGLEIRSEVLEKMYQQTVDGYYKHLKNNRGNKLFLAFCVSLAVTAILLLSLLGQFTYTSIPLLIGLCIGVAIQLHTLIQNWNLYSDRTAITITACTIFSVLCFGGTMFLNTYVASELYFVKWGVLFGVFSTVFIRVFVDGRIRPVIPKLSGLVYSVLFLLLSIYFISFLKLGNMIGSFQGDRWERGTVTALDQFTIFHPVSYYVTFDNDDLGTRLLDLNCLDRNTTEAGITKVQIKVKNGNLGVPWLYRTYDNTDDARQLQYQ